MFNKKYVVNIDECLRESSTVKALRVFANIYWRISTICCGILAGGGFLVSIIAASSEDLVETFSMLLFKMEADETGFSTFLIFFNTFVIYAAIVIFSGVLIRTLFNAGADLLYSNEVSAKIKLLEYNETHPEEADQTDNYENRGSKSKLENTKPIRRNSEVVDNFLNAKSNSSKIYSEESNPDAPYWCGSCGYPGPYDGACPKCYSGMRKYNIK